MKKDLSGIALAFCNHQTSCTTCPELRNGESTCRFIRLLHTMKEKPEDVISRLHYWYETHPNLPQTRAEYFFSQFPDADRKQYNCGRTDIPTVCAKYIFRNVLCNKNCLSCWTRPVETEK